MENIFTNVNNWLKYAEAKNSGIIGINSIIIFGLLELYLDKTFNNEFLNYYIIMIIFFFLLGIVISLLSFVPKLQYVLINLDKPTEKDNLLYFGDIAKYTPIEYYKKITAIINDDTKEEISMLYINQIITNSKITYIKFKQFEFAIWFTLTAFLTPVGTVLLLTIRHYFNQKNNSSSK